ncbi:MAG: zf-HC2 domain-containing protein [Phycisphaerales bacterium]|nr:MAG: zf-HC2 domain-containing protein [Phycisphaerales bacterium]
MSCGQCQELLTAYVEGLLDPQQEHDVGKHLETCPPCQADVTEQREIRQRLVSDAQALTGRSLELPVMTRIAAEEGVIQRRIAMRKQYGKVGLGLAAAAAIAAALIVPVGSLRTGRATAAEVLAQSVEALSDLDSVYIRLGARTDPRDNFASIGLDYDFVSQEMWKQFGDPPKWRVEKPGRVAVMDGESSLLLIRSPQPGVGGGTAVKGGVDRNFDIWQEVLDVDRVLDSELRLAAKNGWDLQLTHEEGSDGAYQLAVTIEADAQGDFTNDWLKNKSIPDSDHRRVFRFDAEHKRLEDLEVWVHGEDEDVLVLDIEEIIYNPDIDPGLFALTLPDDVIWYKQPEVLPDNEKYVRMSPDEAARAFFQACADMDWDEVLKFWARSEVHQGMKLYFGRLEIVSIGEPFQSGQYRGWFVPYEIKLWWGGTKKHNLALRNDNPAGRYIVDGGI